MASEPWQAMISVASYTDFVLKFTLAFGLVFEMPVVITLLSLIGVVTPQFLSKNRKYAILINFVLAAILTPTPDMMTMTIFALPMIQPRIFGYGSTPEVRHVRLAVIDHDGTPASRALVARFTGSAYFDAIAHTQDEDHARRLVDAAPLLADPDQRLLQQVPRVVPVARQRVRQPQQRRALRVDEPREVLVGPDHPAPFRCCST